MEREFLATGKTVEEAIEAAYEKAGVDREYVTVEIIERPKKKFFGLKTVPATAKAHRRRILEQNVRYQREKG